MQLKGKILVGIIFMVIGDLSSLPFGGLWGFVVGALVGHYYIDKKQLKKVDKEHRAYQRRKGQFVYHAFSLCAKMAKADGKVNKAEISLMDQIMRTQFRLTDKGRAQAIKIWKEAKDSQQSFDHYARMFFHDFGTERAQVLDMMNLLFEVAAVDGRLHPREEELLYRAAGIFHISRTQFDRIKGRFFQTPNAPKWKPSDPYYAILGAEPHESLDVIKKKYRELAKKWHPDKVMATGASNAVMQHAKEKFQQINEAYEKIVEMKKT